MARISFVLLAVLILFIQIKCIEAQCSTSNYCFPGTCASSSCTCSDGYSSSASCTDCCDHADGSPTFADTSLNFDNFVLTQSLFAIKDIAYPESSTIDIFYTKYMLNVISGLTYITSVDLNTGISQEIKDKLKMGEDFNCALGACSFVIQGFKSGLVDVIITYQYVYKNQTEVDFPDAAPLPTCLGGAYNFTDYSSIPTPTEDTFECEYKKNYSIPFPLDYGDSVRITYTAKGGTETLVYDQVAMTASNRTGDSADGIAIRILLYDYIEPYNCYVNASTLCSEYSVTSDALFYTLNHYSTTSQTISITSVHGFIDEYSRVLSYTYSVYMLVEGAANHSLHEDFGVGNAVPFNLTDLPLTIPLPDEAGAYSIVLRVSDLADNMRLSRRFVVSDNSSVLERVPAKLPTSPNSILQDVSTHNIFWQSDPEQLLSYQWKDYYTNEEIVTHNWLNPVLAYNQANVEYIYSGYDDETPPMAIQGTVNAHGVIQFERNLVRYENGAFEYNVTTVPPSPPTIWTVIPNVETEYSQEQLDTVSGDAWVLWIRATDIFDHELIDNVVIYIDYSPAMITDLGLKVDDRVTQFVQKSKDITDLVISFKAIDLQSGISSVYWDIEYENQTIIATDTVTVDMLTVEECSVLESTICYCTTAHLCFKRLFDITPNPIKFNITELPHLDTFILKVVVTNYANLTYSDSRTIIIDESPPIAGFVSDSEVGQDDIDYQSESLLHVSWTGFFDRESGVYFYLYGYSNSCLTTDVFVLSDNSTLDLTYSTFASYNAPIPGLYYVTVVAYNLALAKSTPVCSNGITYDITPPIIQNINVVHAKIIPGLVKIQVNSSYYEVWLLDENRERRMLLQSNVSQECIDKATLINDVMIFPPYTIKLRNNTVVDDIYLSGENSYFICESVNAYSNVSYMYTVHELDIRWEGEDLESPIHNYEVGVAETSSQEDAPDLLSYHSTGTIEQFISHHVNTMKMFYIFIRAINRAMLETTITLGPFIVDTTAPVYDNSVISVTLQEVFILGNWSNTAFQDSDEPQQLAYEVALGTEKGLEDVIAFQYITVVAACTGFCTDCVCAGLDTRQLGDFLHSDHTYYLTVRASNGAGLFATGSSDDYTHVAEFPDVGVVIEINPDSTHIDTADFKQIDDVDFQIGTTDIVCRWHGFQHPHVIVTYMVALGTTPGTVNNITSFISTGQHTSYKFTNLTLIEYTKYYVTVIATNVIGSVTAYSNGVTVVPQNAPVMNTANVSIGYGCGVENTNYVQDSDFSQLFMNTSSSPWNITSGQVLKNTNLTFIYLANNTMIQQSLTLLQGNFYTLVVSVSQLSNTSDNEVTITADPMTTRQFTLSQNMSKSYSCEFLADLNTVELTIFSLKSGLRLSSISVKQCVDNIEYQVSTSQVAARWLFPSSLDPFITYYEWAVLHSNGDYVQPYINVGKVYSAQNPSLELMNSNSYYVSVRACSLQISCFQAVNSNMFKVISHPPVAGNIDATYVAAEYGGILNITWEKFENQNSTVDLYEWIYGFGTYSIEFALSPWTLITQDELLNLTIIRNITLNPTQYYFVTIKGYNFAGLSTMMTESVIFNSTQDEGDIYVIDIFPENFKVLGVEDSWTKPNRAYTKNQTALAAVWPKLMNTNFDYCFTTKSTVPLYSECMETPELNTAHNSALITDLMLDEGVKYYFCIYTKNETIPFGGGEPIMIPARSICSNGIVFDNSAPEPGKVYIGFDYGMSSTQYQVSTTDLPVRWNGFMDEEETRGDHHHGIAYYEYAIGSTPNGTDVVSFLNVGFNTHTIATNLTLVSGFTYYATVFAYDYVGLSMAAISDGVTIDNTPPVSGIVTIGYTDIGHADYLSEINVQAYFKGFKDTESGIKDVYWAIGTAKELADIKGFEEAQELDMAYTEEALTDIKDGQTIYVTARVFNNAGLYTQAYSNGTIIDSTPPTRGFVIDGLGEDIDFTKDLHTFSSHWDGFVDPHSDIVEYEWAIGTCETCSDIRAFISTALVQSAIVESISLATGVKYYSIVRACNKAGLCVTASSDGFLVDISPPIAGIVWDGFSAVDQDFQSYRWVVGAHWYGFHDTESGIQKFEWCVGTQPEECDVRTWMNVYKSEYAFLTLRDTADSVELPLNTIIYSTVKIFNNVGLSSQSSSDGFIIDNTFPFFTQQPTFNLTLGSIVPGTQIYKTYLRIMWNSNDTISHVISHRVTVHAHVSNISAVAAQNIGNEQQVLFSELELVDGVRYFARVTACDQSHLCNSSSSDLSVLIDTTPPTVGTFAFDTFTLDDQLNRTLSGTMTWENVNGVGQLQLAWLGFADPHSGISNYSIIVGSGYTQDDLSGGIIVVVDNTTSENEILQATIHLNANLSRYYPNNVIYISIWALNGVGLRSETNQLSFLVTPTADLSDRGILEHQRLDCTIASFYQECTCAALRRLCAARTGNETTQECQPVTNDPYLNISNIVNFHKLDEDHNALVTPSLSLLAASWAFGSVGTDVFTRYQISVGLKAGPGEGLFNIQNENIWFDVGKETFASLSLSALNKTLKSNTDYSFYVRAWVDYSTCYIFQSQVIRVDITPPQLAKRYRPTDVINSTSTTDIDYQSSTGIVMFNWSRVFFDAESGLDYYEVSLGTTEGGSSLSYGFKRIASTVTFYEFTGLNLTAGRRYYSTVCAYNTVGFQTCLSTDGVLIDTEKPLVGVVTDGVTLHDLKYQNFTTSLGGRWHGFVDLHSFIRYYEWAIGSAPYSDSNEDFKNVMAWERAGLNLTMRREELSLQHNTMYYVTVRAVDAAGFISDAVSSNGVLIDTTPPQLMSCDELILEEDFEDFTYRLNDELPVLASNLSILTEPIYDTTPCTCRCSVDNHMVDLEFQSHCCCACGVISLNTGIQPGIFHTSYVDQQSYLQQLTHCCCSYSDTQFDGEYHDCLCDIEDITAGQLGGYVAMGNWELKNDSISQTLSESQFIPRSGDRSFLLRDAIITKEFYLDAGVLHSIVFYANYLGVRGDSILTPPKGRVMGAGIDHVFDLNSHIWESSIAYGWRRFAYQFVPRVSTVDFTFEPYDKSYTIVLDDIGVYRCVELPSSSKGVTLYDTYYTTPNLLQASWVMYDPESYMNFYFWAIGTISGGQQLLPYTLIGNSSQVSAMHLNMQQGTTVFVSAVGINNALLSNYTVSIGVNVELTAPILPGVWDGPGDEDIDYQLLSTTIYMGYDIPYDTESGISYCEWAVGQSKGSANVLEYMRIANYKVGHVQADHEMFADDTKLYSTLRCFNGADIEATLTTNGFTIVNDPPKSDGASVTVIYPQYTPFPKRGNYQATSDHVQFYWEGFQDVTGLESYECRIAGKFRAIIDWVNVGLVHQAYFEDLKLVDRQIYYIYVRAINLVGLKSDPVYTSFYVDIKPPSIIGYIRTSWDRRGYLNIDWTDSFSHTSELKYEFIMGDPPGSDSVESRLSTGLSTLQLPPSEVDQYSFYSVTVTAITISGLTNTISRLVYPASDN